jgi:hypothetical protein
MALTGCETTTPAIKRPQTYALDSTAAGISVDLTSKHYYYYYYSSKISTAFVPSGIIVFPVPCTGRIFRNLFKAAISIEPDLGFR